MAEGLLDETALSNDLVFKKWLGRWELSKLENALNEQGIKKPNDFKFIKSQKHFDKLVSKLNADLTFMDEMRLEEAWKSVQKNVDDKPKVLFVGNEEKEIMEKLHKKYDNVSDDITVIQTAINDLNQSAVNCKHSLNDNLNKMIEVIAKTRKDLTKEIENKRDSKQKEMTELLNKMKYVRQVYCKRKKESDIILSKSDISTSTKIEELKKLLVINANKNDDEKELDFVDIKNLPSSLKLTNNIKQNEFDIKAFNAYIRDNLSIQENVVIHEMLCIINTGTGTKIKFCSKEKVNVEQNGKSATLVSGAFAHCEPGFSKGRHEWKIKLECKEQCKPAIGICSKLNAKWSGSACNIYGNEFAYTWRSYGCDDLYGSNNGEQCFHKKVNKSWSFGETVTIILDVDECYVEFIYKNDLMGRIPIEKQRVYYPFVNGYCSGKSIRFAVVD